MAKERAAADEVDSIIISHEPVILKGNSKNPGCLRVHQDLVTWTNADNELVVKLKYKQIKGQRVSPAQKPKVQLQLTLHEGEPFTFVFSHSKGHEIQLQHREAIKDAVQNALQSAAFNDKTAGAGPGSSSASGQGTDSASAKEQLLSQDKRLAELYKSLVETNFVTPKEFWSDFATTSLDQKSSNESFQTVGVSPAFLSDIQQTDGCNNIRLNLTADIRYQIFKTYPAVQKRHLELVPGEMNEQEFWEAFFRSHYFHRDRTQNLGPKEVFAQCLKLDNETMNQLITTAADHKHSDFNLMSLTDDMEYGRTDEPTTSRDNNSTKAAIIRQFNYHSARVLECGSGRTTDPNKVKSVGNVLNRKRTENGNVEETVTEGPPSKRPRRTSDRLDDTVVDQPLSSTPIKIRVQESKTTTSEARTNSKDTATLRAALNKGLQIDQQTMERELVDTCGDVLSQFTRDLAASEQPEHDKSVVETVTSLYTTLTELLRHFWACFPVKTAETEKKLVRMMTTINKFEEERMNVAFRKVELKYREHLDQQITAAINKYDSWMNRRSSKSST